ncbi:hypothetical protein JTY60_00140 [symbiont of Argiope bruennichi]|uniref:FtsX-like permease family protein n=1 Tax=symbiont of Argiope bruennichi TaxID=2810479 RepID=UPI003DA520B0
MFDNAYNSLLIALSILFIVIICLSIGISLIIIAVTNSNILQDNKKNLFVMKALGYKDREINNIISKIYTYILFFVYFVSLIPVYFCTIYALNFIFSTNEIFVPSTFKLWEIPIGILLLFIVYYVNKIISFNIIKKLNLSSELKK